MLGRIWKPSARYGFGRFSKREPPIRQHRQLTAEARARMAAILAEKPYLGPECTVWDLQNSEQITVSASTIKRMKRELNPDGGGSALERMASPELFRHLFHRAPVHARMSVYVFDESLEHQEYLRAA